MGESAINIPRYRNPESGSPSNVETQVSMQKWTLRVRTLRGAWSTVEGIGVRVFTLASKSGGGALGDQGKMMPGERGTTCNSVASPLCYFPLAKP